jgi:hypothetical protein
MNPGCKLQSNQDNAYMRITKQLFSPKPDH